MEKLRVREIDYFFYNLNNPNLTNRLPIISLNTLIISYLLFNPNILITSLLLSLGLSIVLSYNIIKFNISSKKYIFLKKLKQHTIEYQNYNCLNYTLLSPYFYNNLNKEFRDVFNKEKDININKINYNSKEYLKEIIYG